jgi:hypothetical protein
VLSEAWRIYPAKELSICSTLIDLEWRKLDANGQPQYQQEKSGAGGIRTLGTVLRPYNGLANHRLQPLGHSSKSI